MAIKKATRKQDGKEVKPADVKPIKPSGDSKERRLFQRSPDDRAWLTRDEAIGEGFYWNDNPES